MQPLVTIFCGFHGLLGPAGIPGMQFLGVLAPSPPQAPPPAAPGCSAEHPVASLWPPKDASPTHPTKSTLLLCGMWAMIWHIVVNAPALEIISQLAATTPSTPHSTLSRMHKSPPTWLNPRALKSAPPHVLAHCALHSKPTIMLKSSPEHAPTKGMPAWSWQCKSLSSAPSSHPAEP